MISKILTGNLFWIVFFLFVVTSVQARNEYLNDGANTCDQGSWEAYTEVRQHEYKTGSSAESQDQVVGWRFRKSIGDVCDEEFVPSFKYSLRASAFTVAIIPTKILAIKILNIICMLPNLIS